MKTALLVFEDGTSFKGTAFAGEGEVFGEVVFNTAMTGYQEILTDPSYADQMVVMTYPLIGNYGVNDEDTESRGLFLKAMIVREYCDMPSNFRSQKTLKTYLEDHQIIGIENLDTRALTRYIRDNGAKKAILTTANESVEALAKKAAASTGMVGKELATQVATKSPYIVESPNRKYRVAVIDCGVKTTILTQLAKHGCECHVLPPNSKAEDILKSEYDGLFISNGPGDPEPVKDVITLLKDCLGKIPIFGICLGHQLLGLALGGKTYKLGFGHHGANHPVKNLLTGEVEISSQNHGFCVDIDTLNPDDVEITHINLNDQTVAGIRHKTYPAFSVQYHPEAGPGPHDSRYLFQNFVDLMEAFRS